VRTLIRQAQIEKDTPNTPPKACREIFQFWSDLAQSADSAEQSVPKNSESSQDA
jgi:ribosome-associated protein